MSTASPQYTFPLSEFETSRTIEFADTDMGGIVHFSRFFVFMETAEHELLRALGAEVHMTLEGQNIGWPRVEASCRYLNPAKLGDVLQINVRVFKKGKRSMVYEITFSRNNLPIAVGRIASVCCVMGLSEGLQPINIPPTIADKLAETSNSASSD